MFSFLLVFIFLNSLTLSEEEAVNLAIKNNPLLKAQKENLEVSDFEIKIARSSFYPSFAFSGSFTHTSEVMEMVTPRLLYLEPDPQHPGRLIPVYTFEKMRFSQPNSYSFGFGVSYPIFTWFSRINNLRVSKLKAKTSEIDYEISKLKLEAQVRKAYYQALMARALYELARKALDEKKANYEAVKEKYESGQASDFELLRAEVEYKTSEPQVIEAENAYKNSLDMLRSLLELPETTTLVLKDTLSFIPFDEDLKSLQRVADTSRLDLKKTNLNLESLKYLKKVVEASVRPSILGSWQIGYQKPFGFENKWKHSWRLSLQLNFPIFDGFKTKSEIGKLEAQRRQLEFLKESQRRISKLEVLTAYRNVINRKRMLESQIENIKLARRMYKMALEQYKSGFASSLDVINAEVAFLSARVNYIVSLANYRSAIVDLKLALRAGSESSITPEPQSQGSSKPEGGKR